MTVVNRPILGPNFCNLDRDQKRTFFVGDVNVSNVRSRYLQSVDRLAIFIENDADLSKLPILINTMGFNSGLGVVLMKKILNRFAPTSIVSLRSRFPSKNYDLRFRSCPAYTFLEFNAMPESATVQNMRSEDTWGVPQPRKLRDLVVLSRISRWKKDLGHLSLIHI